MLLFDYVRPSIGVARPRTRHRLRSRRDDTLNITITNRRPRAASRRSACIGMALQFVAATPALCKDPEYTIAIRDHRFVPALISIPAGLKVRLILDNQGETAEEFDSHALNREKHVPPRTQAVVFVGPLGPGRYVFQGEESDDPGGPALGIIEAR